MKLAVVGSGIAGLGCAHVLGDHHDVTIFESDARLGGHAHTVTVDDPDVGPLSIDVGFIVHNDRTYPNLSRLFEELGVAVQDTEMSFAVTDRNFGGRGETFTYRATSPRTLFADPRNLIRRDMWQMLADIVRFQRDANRILDEERSSDSTQRQLTLDDYLQSRNYSTAFVDAHLLPLGASVWSADPTSFAAFPAVSLFRFLRNHGLLGIGNRPQWRTVVGGSSSYVDAIANRFRGSIRPRTPVLGIRRDDQGATVRTATGDERFDRVILACHSDQAVHLLDDASVAEKEVLGAIAYQPNSGTLHTDTRVLSPRARAWAAWNYECATTSPGVETRATLTYDLTTLQRLGGSQRYLVSLNNADSIRPESVLASFEYAHPVFDTAAMAAQNRFDEIDGVNATHFCGAYWGYGFHEDGFESALRVCRKLGVNW